MDFPGGSVVKNLLANAGEIGNDDDKNVREDRETHKTQEDLLINLGVCT